jgi:DnaJ-class molecular chaperone
MINEESCQISSLSNEIYNGKDTFMKINKHSSIAYLVLALVASATIVYAAVCSSCNGSGRSSTSCQQCKGTGKVSSGQCMTCVGTGWLKCAFCSGTGHR